jgi:predicted dinucleotide-binding enzyme
MRSRALDAVLGDIGAAKGKLVVDCTNAVERGMQLKYGHTTSSAEELPKRIPEAHVFKSFNAQGAENLASPEYPSGRASNFFCGDDASARERMRTLVSDAGFDPVDAGPLDSARLLEPLMLLWVRCSKTLGTCDIAFRLLRR